MSVATEVARAAQLIIDQANTAAKLLMTPVFNVLGFGAKGDGATDASAAVQAAIDAVPVGGGIVFFPPGWYKVTSTLRVINSLVTFMGTGKNGAASLVTNNHNFDIISVTGDDFQANNLRIFDTGSPNTGNFALRVSGNGATLQNLMIGGVNSGIFLDSANARIQNVDIRDIRPTLGIGITIDTLKEVIYLDSISVENAAGQNASAGINIKSGSAVSITNANIMKMGHALLINPSGGRNVFSTSCANVFFDTSSGNAVALAPAAGSAVLRSKFVGCWLGSCNRGLDISGDCRGITITGTEFFGNTTDGIRVRAGATVKNLQVTGSAFAGNGGVGISLEAGVSDVTINGCKIGPHADFGPNTHGIYIDVGAGDRLMITNNQVFGNTTTQIADGSTGLKKVVANNIT